MSKPQKISRTFLLVAGALIALVLLTRNIIVTQLFRHAAQKVENRFGITVSAQRVSVKGISTLQIKDLLAKSSNDTVFLSGIFTVRLNPFYLLILKANPKHIEISGAQVRLDKILDKFSHIELNKPSKVDSKRAVETSSGTQQIYRAIKAFFGLSTATFNIDTLRVLYADTAYQGNIEITHWHFNKNSFISTVKFNDAGTLSTLSISGSTSKRNNSITATVVSEQPSASIPFTKPLLGTKVSFNNLKFDLNAKSLHPDRIDVNLRTTIQPLIAEGKRIATSTVQFDSLGCNLNVTIIPGSYAIDTLSTVTVNGFKASIGMEYIPNQNRLIKFNLSTGENSWQALFDALPNGLFTNLKGIRVNGDFSYIIRLNVPLSVPDSLTIAANLRSKGFYVVSWGKTNLSMLNDTFTYRVFKNESFVKDIEIAAKSQTFTPLNQINPSLQWAVITSEDGGFYNHRGFSLEGITYAMACNIREGRFARGGSTITQQLVKNIFLTQNKNIGRKAEEFLITWIIESTGLVSKERILELYLNILEWGPNIYGIKEASQFYFSKKPANLTLTESLFLAYIIPRPTKFKYLFHANGELKPFVIENFRFVASKMLMRGNICQQEYDEFINSPQIKLTGNAKDLLKGATETSSENVDFDNIFENVDDDSN